MSKFLGQMFKRFERLLGYKFGFYGELNKWNFIDPFCS